MQQQERPAAAVDLIVQIEAVDGGVAALSALGRLLNLLASMRRHRLDLLHRMWRV